MKRLITFGVLGLTLVFHGTLWADQEKEAKEAYSKGRSLYLAGKYSEAAVQLKRAFELKPHPALLRYLGDTFYKMNQAKEALKYYKQYLVEAPEAADREKVEAKVQQLELIIGASEEGQGKKTIPPPPKPQVGTPPPVGSKAPTTAPPQIEPSESTPVALTGEDKEIPMNITRAGLSTSAQPRARQPSKIVPIFAWVTLAVGVGGLAVGVVFNRLAASKANELEDIAKKDNPDLNNPVETFQKPHFDLQQSYKQNNLISIIGFAAGGAIAAASVALFVIDLTRTESPKRTSQNNHHLHFAPMMGLGTYGVAAEMGF
jgi:tetratricopeptide (TPR) repeat protein